MGGEMGKRKVKKLTPHNTTHHTTHPYTSNSTLSDPHFPALVAEMEQALAQHMWLFFPATADEE